MLRYILLGFLHYQPMTGYDLKRLIDQSTGHFWHAYHSQIYTTLRKMEQEGLVSSELDSGDDKLEKRIYTLLPAGEAELKNWLRHPLTELPQSKDDLMVRMFFSGLRSKTEVLEELRLQRRLHQQLLEQYQGYDLKRQSAQFLGEERDVGYDLEFWKLTLEHGYQYEVMYLKWLDEAIARIEQL